MPDRGAFETGATTAHDGRTPTTTIAASFYNSYKRNSKIKQKKTSQQNNTRQSHKAKANHAQSKTQTSSRRSSAIFWASAQTRAIWEQEMETWNTTKNWAIRRAVLF
jgi:hypothetical protein